MPRGRGRGVGGNRQYDRGSSKCYCPQCNKVYPHESSMPCMHFLCPQCGGQLKGTPTAQ